MIKTSSKTQSLCIFTNSEDMKDWFFCWAEVKKGGGSYVSLEKKHSGVDTIVEG